MGLLDIKQKHTIHKVEGRNFLSKNLEIFFKKGFKHTIYGGNKYVNISLKTEYEINGQIRELSVS